MQPCAIGTLKAWAASWPFALPLGGLGPLGGGGGAASENKKKLAPEATTFFFFFFFFLPPPPPPPPSPSVLFAYSFTWPPSPLLLPYQGNSQETPDCHALPPPHEPPNPPFLIVLIARNLGTHQDASQCLKTKKSHLRKTGGPTASLSVENYTLH